MARPIASCGRTETFPFSRQACRIDGTFPAGRSEDKGFSRMSLSLSMTGCHESTHPRVMESLWGNPRFALLI